MDKTETIEKIKRRIKSLPLIDKAVFDIMSLLNNPDSNFENIIDKLSPDLSARFLNMANMAHYGKEVRSIGFAVRVLGYREMKNILVSSILIDHLTKRLNMSHFSFEKFQTQAQFCAAVSRILGEILGYANLEDLFTVSVLHNIGKLVIVVYFNDEHHMISQIKMEKGLPARDVEMDVLGATHSEIGAIVLERFQIPADICDAVRYHDSVDRDLSQSKNFELEFIFRESAGIVRQYRLPEGMFPMDLVRQMSDTIKEGREVCLEEVRNQIRSRGYIKLFRNVLNEASFLVKRDLSNILDKREKVEGQ